MLKKLGGVLAIVGVIMVVLGFRNGIAGLKEPVDLYAYETNVSEIGYFDMVTVDVYEVLGAFATNTTTENGRKTNEDSYYMIPAHEGDEYRYIGIRVNEREYDMFDKMYDDTWDYYDGYLMDLDKHVVKTGCLKKMNKKLQEFYYGALREAGWYETEEEMKAEALPYYIDPVANPKSLVTFLIVGVILAVVGGVLFFLGMKSENRQIDRAAAQTYVMIAGVSYPKSTFAHVNQCVQGQEKIFAAQELADITGLSLDEAGKVIENWRQYYY